MKRIALTGGMGTGKSHVRAVFAALGPEHVHVHRTGGLITTELAGVGIGHGLRMRCSN